jgi:hypothetical protein
MRRIQKMPLSKYFNCGSELAGPNADHYRLLLAVAAFVDSTSGGTRVRVSMAAGANDIEGSSKRPVNCASNGTLEELVGNLVTVHLAGLPEK